MTPNLGTSKTPVLSVVELGRVYIENRNFLCRYANKILKDSTLAEDVVQDAFVKLTLAAPELQSTEHALAYMHRTIKNLCIDVIRSSGRRPSLVLLDEVTADIEMQSYVSPEPSELLGELDDAAIVRQALSLLSPAERAALVMWEIDGRSSEEISVELGIKKSAVRHTVSRARASLRKVLAQIVIDHTNNLTALDLLTSSYKRASRMAKKSSKATLSLLLFFSAFLGFREITANNLMPSLLMDQSFIEAKTPETKEVLVIEPELVKTTSLKPVQKNFKPGANVENPRVNGFKFPGLNKSGVPEGFTVSDSTGSIGNAYFRERTQLLTEEDMVVRNIIKTESNAANVLISQTLRAVGEGFEYQPVVAFGQDGAWKPLLVSVYSMDMRRQTDGTYLVTARIAVEYEVSSSIEIAASADGRDLERAPKQVITRMVLSPDKTQVLAQAIHVVENGVRH